MDAIFLKQKALELWHEAQRHHLSGDLNQAIRLYTRSIRVYPTAEAYTFRAWAYSFQDRLEKAIQECHKAIALDPSLGNPYNDIGSYLVALGKFDEAVEWFEKAKTATRYETRHFPYMNLGRVYVEKGMIQKAIREFEAALEICPGEPRCEAILGQLKRSLH